MNKLLLNACVLIEVCLAVVALHTNAGFGPYDLSGAFSGRNHVSTAIQTHVVRNFGID